VDFVTNKDENGLFFTRFLRVIILFINRSLDPTELMMKIIDSLMWIIILCDREGIRKSMSKGIMFHRGE
jgi:hypothetical protein